MAHKRKKSKKVLVQIGREFYSLKPEFKIKDADELSAIIDKYDVKLLREDE